MYLSFEWLNDYLDLTGLTGEALADRMSRTGIDLALNLLRGLSLVR